MSSDVADQAAILTERLVLRPVEEADRDAFERAWRDSRQRLVPWLPRAWGDRTPAQAFDLHLKQQATTERDGTGFRRLATTHAGELVGTFNLSNIVRGPLLGGYAAWNLFTGRTGHGYATEAATALFTHAFTELGLHRLQANVVPGNHASLRLAERLGLRREGYAVRYLEINGRWQDHVMFAKLAEEHLET